MDVPLFVRLCKRAGTDRASAEKPLSREKRERGSPPKPAVFFFTLSKSHAESATRLPSNLVGNVLQVKNKKRTLLSAA
jgi:hypothetical protein